MKQVIDISDQKFSFLGSSTTIKGDLVIRETSHIAGKIEGSLKVETEAVFLERTSKVFGKIDCHHIDIHGTFEGEIVSQGNVTIYPTANVIGKIQSKNLVIYPGAKVTIDGQTKR